MKDLEIILKYKMTDMEKKAYKIALLWEEECRKEIPKENYSKLKRNADPRKSVLFKYCYKLAKEMKGILNDEDFVLYIRSQIQILKSIRENSIHAMIEPHCLVGDKAWRRWKLWKYKFSKIINKISTSDDIQIKAKDSKVISELNSDFELLKKLEINSIQDMESNKIKIKRNLYSGELSFYYAVLSPWFKKVFSNQDVDFDRIYFQSCINPKIEKFFKEKFINEF